MSDIIAELIFLMHNDITFNIFMLIQVDTCLNNARITIIDHWEPRLPTLEERGWVSIMHSLDQPECGLLTT